MLGPVIHQGLKYKLHSSGRNLSSAWPFMWLSVASISVVNFHKEIIMLLSILIHVLFKNIMKNESQDIRILIFSGVSFLLLSIFFQFYFLKFCQNLSLKKVSPLLKIHKERILRANSSD